jgi:hypothetical protein
VISRTTSVAMTATVAEALRAHVDRPDGQEDICLATYRPSTGPTRTTALLTSVITPMPGEREVHGNASIFGDYVLRAAVIAHRRGDGLVLCHSHPGSRGWQPMSGPDFDAEHSFANLARELTGHPLVGVTYSGGDQTWSARHWDQGTGLDVSPTHCDNVRVIGDRLDISWNNELVPPAAATGTQRRSVSCWGAAVHTNLVRRKVLVVGAGSVGLDVAIRLAATGMIHVSVMDFDTVEPGNIDRLIGATRHDAIMSRAKTEVAERLMRSAATSIAPGFQFFDLSICEPKGFAVALDQDMIICCVDRPWARVILNQIAYSDLVPVIDGGISIDVFNDGNGMRNATWRSHVLRPGRACLVCNDQVDISEVSLDIQGLLDDPIYIAGAGRQPGGQNVALLSVSATASLLAQFVSFNVAPGGIGDPGPLQYLLSTHTLEHLGSTTRPGCPFEHAETAGDERQDLSGEHAAAQGHRARRSGNRRELVDSWLERFATRLRKRVAAGSTPTQPEMTHHRPPLWRRVRA